MSERITNDYFLVELNLFTRVDISSWKYHSENG